MNHRHLIFSSFVQWPGDLQFSIQITDENKPKIVGFDYVMSLFCYQKSFRAFAYFVNIVHNLHVGFPVVALVNKFLSHFRNCEIKFVNFVKDIIVRGSLSNYCVRSREKCFDSTTGVKFFVEATSLLGSRFVIKTMFVDWSGDWIFLHRV